MAATATLFVLDASARRTTVKVSPSKLMQDVLVEACTAKKLDPSGWTLKTASHKVVDLSQPFRLSGLSAGAKLQLVQASRSPGVVNVGLQIEGVDGRLQDRFPSTTTLWTVLRQFEDGVAGAGAKRKLNITQRGIPESESGAGSGVGRLVYEQPTATVENRVLEGFGELQKTLAQLGYNGGSVLVRVGFRRTQVPLEEAMGEMSAYFQKESGEGQQGEAMQGVTTNGAAEEAAAAPVESDTAREPLDVATSPAPTHAATAAIESDPPEATPETQPQPAAAASTSPSQQAPPQDPNTTTANPFTVYLPPTSTTPAASLLHPDDPSTFEPTIDNYRTHQASLTTRSQNQRLKSDAELAEIESTKQTQLAAVQSVRVRVQYPDQHVLETSFSASATAAELYGTVRETLCAPTEAFELRFFGSKGRLETIPDLASKRLVRDLGFRGAVKVTLAAPASATAAEREGLRLKEVFVRQARELNVELVLAEKERIGSEAKVEEKDGSGKGKGKAKAGGDVEAKMKKFLGFGGRK
ncbi:hypothetical protein LTR53_011514 [Teratosphaeriaceae sp. CCFEE 6253]|nr:hypothetical protein LTR53_011514 [Teratosphaeriaceae sp. CCFEE 6253]